MLDEEGSHFEKNYINLVIKVRPTLGPKGKAVGRVGTKVLFFPRRLRLIKIRSRAIHVGGLRSSPKNSRISQVMAE